MHSPSARALHHFERYRALHHALGGVMHSPSARALQHLERYCIIRVHTLKHLMPDKCYKYYL